jgi:hypothetical protein
VLNSVCDEELNEIHKDRDWPLVTPSVRDSTETTLDRLLGGSEPIPKLNEWQRHWDVANSLKDKHRALLVDLRNRHFLSREASLVQYYQTMAEESAALLIHQRLNVARPDIAFNLWKRDPARFPHFTAYLEFSIYSFFDAERNQNAPLDRNWQADAGQLCFLVDVDVMVSSDRGFFKRAFEGLLWPSQQKRLLTPALLFSETIPKELTSQKGFKRRLKSYHHA